MLEQFAYLLAEETGDDCRRSLVCAQSMCVGGTHNARLEESVMAIHSHKSLHEECHETQVLLSILAWCMQQYPCVSRKTPVVVLTTTVDAVERLFVQQYTEPMLTCHLLHQRHQQHVMVYGEVHLLVYGRKFKLVWCHLVVACLARNGQFECLYLKVFHERLHAVGDGAKVMVVHLLVLR